MNLLNSTTRHLPYISRVVVLLGTILTLSGCKDSRNGTYTNRETGLAPEIIRLDGKSAWVGPPDAEKEYRVIKKGEVIRIESIDGRLRGNFRHSESGILCLENNRFYRREP